MSSVILCNVQSLTNKIDELPANVQHLSEYRNQSWLTNMDTDSDLTVTRFARPFRLDRQGVRSVST